MMFVDDLLQGIFFVVIYIQQLWRSHGYSGFASEEHFIVRLLDRFLDVQSPEISLFPFKREHFQFNTNQQISTCKYGQGYLTLGT